MHHNKKVTFLISSLAGGGAEGVCVNISNGLAEQGWDVTLLVLNLKNSVFLDRVSKKVAIKELKVNQARQAFFKLRDFIKKNNVQKLVVFNYELTIMSIFVRYTLFRKFKIITRNINTISENINSDQISFLVRFTIKKFYAKADHVINQCNGMQNDLLKVIPALKNKSSVIYNPVNSSIEKFSENINFNNIEKGNYILCVGRLEEQKAFHYAIEVFSRIYNKYPGLRLKIVGQGSLEQDLKQLAVKIGVSKFVDFEGFKKDIKPYYLGANLTLMTSLYEGFPNVLVESITLGTPVVSFDCQNGPSEIIIPEVNGYLIKQFNIGELSLMVDKILKKNLIFNYLDVKKSSVNYSNEFILKQWLSLLYN
ncbi:hypothetical protein NFHSH190041_26450 [Shewanella sp. NFH-SH190041]|uniref:glycosyltransferase n=1 Tax=Shewanella sp. NFH-SH190041 TaxID=2950245 RepID=UPI0021C4AADA|nr:glycosyltransferase [Shewanella sp. NFH-SH190041]BDM65193.1 hypothetical protein NFHSH190041_26450 [Shewanella sp. NFH-SH190041]